MPATFTAADLVDACRGVMLQGWEGHAFVGVSTDSRTCQAGEIFVPLAGERHDGHVYIDKAVTRGVRGVLVADRALKTGLVPPLSPDIAVVAVADTLTALGDLAQAWRRRFAIPVVSLTGSCGKTTAKEMIALILSRFFRVLKNELNLNNLIGLPQTLLQLDGSFEAAVVEMGMNHFGEIRRLTEISRPTVGALLNVYPAHTEGVGSIEGVALAKGELVRALSPESTLVYNADDDRVTRLAAGFAGRRLGFGFGPMADVRGHDRYSRGTAGQIMEVAWQGSRWPLTLSIPGLHQAMNALAAAAVALALGLPPEATSALADFTAIHRRSQVQDLPMGVHLLNDCYNANPGSMATALATLAELKGTGRAAAALADMLELGRDAAQAHRQLGRQAAAAVDFLVIFGKYSGEVEQGAIEAGLDTASVFTADSREMAAALLRDFLRPGDWLLVKGSRSMHMENIIELLQPEKKGQPDGDF